MIFPGGFTNLVMNVTTQELVQLQSKTVSLIFVASADVLRLCILASFSVRAAVKPAHFC